MSPIKVRHLAANSKEGVGKKIENCHESDPDHPTLLSTIILNWTDPELD